MIWKLMAVYWTVSAIMLGLKGQVEDMKFCVVVVMMSLILNYLDRIAERLK